MVKDNEVYVAGGLIGALLASTCGMVPFGFLLSGVNGAWMNHVTVLASYQPKFLVAGLVLLAAELWKVHGKSHTFCRPLGADPLIAATTKAGFLSTLSQEDSFDDEWHPRPYP